jgi:hypothetical protein
MALDFVSIIKGDDEIFGDNSENIFEGFKL